MVGQSPASGKPLARAVAALIVSFFEQVTTGGLLREMVHLQAVRQQRPI